MDLNFNFDGKTKLKDWWGQVKANFETIKSVFEEHEEKKGTSSVYGHVRLSDSTSASALSSTDTNVPTVRDVYYGMPKFNNLHTYTSSSSYYAPTAGGDAGYELVGNGTSAAPVWKAPSYAECSSSAATAAKTASIANFKLVKGTTVRIRFLEANTAASPTLNISGTGAKSIARNVDGLPVRPSSSDTWEAGEIVEFLYNGTYWFAISSNMGYAQKKAATIVVTETSDLQKAIDSLPDAGGRILLREGTYNVKEELSCTKDVVFEGMGMGTIINVTGSLLKTSSKRCITFRDIYVSADEVTDGVFNLCGTASELYLENSRFVINTAVSSDNICPTALVYGYSDAPAGRVNLNGITAEVTFDNSEAQCGAVFRGCYIRGGTGCRFIIDRQSAGYAVQIFYCCGGCFSNGYISGTEYVCDRNMSITGSYISCVTPVQHSSDGIFSTRLVDNRIVLKNGYLCFSVISGNEIIKQSSGMMYLLGRVVSGNVIQNYSSGDTSFSEYSSVTGNVSKYTLSSTTPTGCVKTGNVVCSSLTLPAMEG